MTQDITPTEAELTRSESMLAQQMFQQAFPELVRRLRPNELEEAAAKTTAALVAGLIAIREATGNRP